MAAALDHVDDEMHELNQEADYLDQTITPGTNGVNGIHKPIRHSSSSSDPDAQAQVIASLRSQVQDLYSQVSQLNNKLVRSYDRVSDLEDELHVTSASLQNATVKVSQLQLEHAQHVSALSTGLLVEKANVTTELTRLMERATEEAARAGEAESARVAIEQDLDDLSASLFNQANMMVAEARLARARSERKAEETEAALRGAEEIVGILQTQMQTLQAQKEEAIAEMRAIMGKGKWVDRSNHSSSIRLLCLHAPYLEFLQFISHLRSIRPSTQNVPAMSTLLPLPFLARLITEDSDPTVRLDLAPSLNWLTRRSVLSAIHSGQLMVEPMSTATLLEELAPPSIPGHSHSHVVCALCGTTIIETPSSPTKPSSHPNSPTRATSGSKSSWGPSFLKTSLVQTIASTPFSYSTSQPGMPATPSEPPSQVYIFRLETTSSSGLPVSLPPAGPARPATIYPLCTSGWCLARLRTTCSLWAFIRTGIVERVWEEEPFAPPTTSNTPTPETPETPSAESSKRARIGIGAIWGSMSRSLSSTSKPESEKSAADLSSPKTGDTLRPVPPAPLRRMPPPPPRHRPLPPPVAPGPAGPPPPLPKRNRPVPPLPPRRGIPAAETPQNEEAEPATDGATAPTPDLPRAHSSEDTHDQFTTPTEEIAHSDLSRPVSPTAVPLPPSEPSSPLLTAVDDGPQDNQKAEESSAAPLTVNSDVDESPSSPERPSSPSAVPSPVPEAVPASETATAPAVPAAPGVPPPLPRRAATRARPTSLAAQSAPVEPAPETSEHDIKNVPDFTTTDEVVEEKPPEIITTEPTSPPLEGIDEQDDLRDMQSLDLHSEDERHSVEMVTVSSEEISVNTTADHTEEPDSDTYPDKEASHDGQSEDEDEDARSQPEIELDTRAYVGYSSWEEKTWRELVKLRENMYWARIGGVR